MNPKTSGSFEIFPSSKIDFWPFFKLQKMEIGKKNFFVRLKILLFHEFFFGAWTFFNFLAHYVFASQTKIDTF